MRWRFRVPNLAKRHGEKLESVSVRFAYWPIKDPVTYTWYWLEYVLETKEFPLDWDFPRWRRVRVGPA